MQITSPQAQKAPKTKRKPMEFKFLKDQTTPKF